MATPTIRLRSTGPGMLSLPWFRPLSEWAEAGVLFHDMPVGASRHVVRFVDADGTTFALKELPIGVARAEYDVLRGLEVREFPAVRPVGLVERAADGDAILVTQYLEGSFQFRRLFQRLPLESRAPRERLLDAMASLLVELHRVGVFWGDCSLANTLFRRDGQTLQAFLVDAETSEAHPALTDGQREFDLDILVENVAGDLADLGAMLGRPADLIDEDLREAESVARRYRTLWDELHGVESIAPDETYRIEARIRRLNELGFTVDEVNLEPDGGRDHVRLKVSVTSRRFHAQELRRRTGLEVGEGQATVLLNDLRAYRGVLERRTGAPVPREVAAERWLAEVVRPAMQRLAASPHPPADLIQGYCDLTEVRWLLSEREGHDVGDDAAIEALAGSQAPPGSAAIMAAAESPTGVFSLAAWSEELGADEVAAVE